MPTDHHLCSTSYAHRGLRVLLFLLSYGTAGSVFFSPFIVRLECSRESMLLLLLLLFMSMA
jgi:hypothetical protein